jgi:hypothetical protein
MLRQHQERSTFLIVSTPNVHLEDWFKLLEFAPQISNEQEVLACSICRLDATF